MRYRIAMSRCTAARGVAQACGTCSYSGIALTFIPVHVMVARTWNDLANGTALGPTACHARSSLPGCGRRMINNGKRGSRHSGSCKPKGEAWTGGKHTANTCQGFAVASAGAFFR